MTKRRTMGGAWRFVTLAAFMMGLSLIAAPEGERFTAEISCELQCVGQSSTGVARFVKTFSATERGLRRGNGGYWGMLSWHVGAWAREWCLDAALTRCSPDRREISAVAHFRVEGLRSGRWQVTGPIDCAERSRAIPSPFGTRLKAVLAEGGKPSSAPSALRTRLRAEKRGPALACETWVSASVCAGDCLAPLTAREPSVLPGSEEWVETLASAHPGLTSTQHFCADPFIAHFRGRGLSAVVLAHYCDEFLWNGVIGSAREPGISSCAATRITSHCEEAIRKIREE